MSEKIGKICSNKDCIHHGEKQPYDNFYKSNIYKDGHLSQCKDCYKERGNRRNKKRDNEYYGFFNLFM